MKFSHKLSDAMHLLAYLEIFKDKTISSKELADSVNTNPSTIRNLVSNLKASGLVKTSQGKVLTKLVIPASEISMYDVYCAINMEHRLLHLDLDTNKDCIVGSNIASVLDGFYDDIEQAAFEKMKLVSVKDVVNEINNKIIS